MRSVRERYDITDPKCRRFRYGVQVNSLGLTEQQPENNVHAHIAGNACSHAVEKGPRPRRAIARVERSAWAAAPWDQQWSMRMQQILAYETDLLEFGDLFDGNPAIDAKTDALIAAARSELDQIEAMGGAMAAVGHMKSRLVESNAARIARIESGETIVVGVNKWTESEESPLTTGPNYDSGS